MPKDNSTPARDAERNKAWVDADAKIRKWMDRQSAPGVDPEAVIGDANERWLKKYPDPNNSPVFCAEKAFQDALRERDRHRDLERRHEDTIRARTISGATDHDESEPRAERYAEHQKGELEAAVRETCARLFEQRFSLSWQADWKRFVFSEDDQYRDEQEGDRVLADLRSAMKRAVDFVERDRGVRHAPRNMGWWVGKFIKPLINHSFLKDGQRSSPLTTVSYRAELHRFIRTWDTYNMLGLAPRQDGRSRILSAEEFTWVRVLAGEALSWKKQWPSNGMTVKEAIAQKRNTIEHAIKSAGKWSNFRGPETPVETSEKNIFDDSEV